MTPSTFRGRTMDDAQQAARAALGEDAVILTARRVRREGLGGLFGGVEIEVAATAPSPPPSQPPEKAPVSRGPFASSAYVEEPVRSRRSESVAALRQEIRSMQGLMARSTAAPASSPGPTIEAELAALREAVDRLAEPSLFPRAGVIGRVLRETGLEGKAAAELLKALKGAEGMPQPEMLRDALADMVKVAPWPLTEQGTACIALVGPSGVGKTTTAAKLAGRAMHELGKTVTFVTCDCMRVGAFEQLDRFAELLGAQMVAARTSHDLVRAVETAETDLVIVDTAGRSPARGDSPERMLRSLPGTRSRRTRAVLLCLPASVRADDAVRFAKDYAPTQPTALVITKLDETVAPAGLVHGAMAAKLPLSVLCFGQNVPEDMAPATTGAIVDYLLPKGASRRRAS